MGHVILDNGSMIHAEGLTGSVKLADLISSFKAKSSFEKVVVVECIHDGRKITIDSDGAMTVVVTDSPSDLRAASVPMSEMTWPMEFWKNLACMLTNNHELLEETRKKLKEVSTMQAGKVTEVEKIRYTPIGNSTKKNLLLAGMTMGKKMAEKKQ